MKMLFLFTFVFLVARGRGQNFDFNNMMNQNCPNFRCSSGHTPAPKSRTKFESTGCSSMGGGAVMMNMGETGEKPYESCCHQWHACYQICGVSKKTCDSTFDACAKETCGDDDEKCTKDVELSTMMMKLGGCKKFDESQYQACECTPSDQASQKREAAIRYFYKKYAPENVEKSKSLAAKADTPSKLAGLFVKLLLKYPDSIVKKDDPMKTMFDKIKVDTESSSSSSSSGTETVEEGDEEIDSDSDSEDNENIEL